VRISLGLFLVMFVHSLLADELTRAVQEQLQAQGAYSGPLDGKRSAEFSRALRAYQQRHNLPASGVIDRATAKALDDESGLALPEVSMTPPAMGPPASSRPAPPPPISRNSIIPVPSSDSAADRGTTPVPISPTAPTATPPPTISPAATPSATSPPQTAGPSLSPSSTISPAPPEESPPPFTVERITKFLRDYLHAGEGKYVTPQLRFFSFPVDYFTHGSVNQQFVRSDTLRYMRRWPRRRYMLVEPVKVGPMDNDTATADFTVTFTVQRGKRRSNGRTSNRVTLREIKGALKIVAIKEQREQD
jgi:Putative peptidoglycan binding domain